MTEEEFERLASAYGGDLARWPEHLRGKAAELARRVPRSGKMLQAEYAFDEYLRTAAPAVPAERAGAVMAAAAGAIARQRRAAVYRPQLWQALSLTYATCAILGFALGFAMSGTLGPGSHPPDAIALLSGGNGDLGFLSR
jgi:hypothetical protein